MTITRNCSSNVQSAMDEQTQTHSQNCQPPTFSITIHIQTPLNSHFRIYKSLPPSFHHHSQFHSLQVSIPSERLPAMASNSMNSFITLLLLTTSLSAVASFEFQVGGTKGWVVPPANDTRIYNDWASENRFRAGDAVRFRYKKDSVMEVTEEEYKRCNSTQPSFFSNTGNTVFHFGRSGTFYFISGANGHCERGQRMIIKVMAEEDSSPSHHSEKSTAARARISSLGFLKFVSVPLALSCFSSILF